MNLPNSLGLPSTQYLDGYFEGWKPDDSMYIGKDLLPEEGHPFPAIEWDQLAGVAGITNAHSLDAPPPMVAHRGRTKRTELPFYFGDMQKLVESDFLNIRALGTFNRMAGKELVTKGTEQMLARLVARVEQTRWKAMQGSLAISENGVVRTVTYSTKSISNPSISWATVASAVPVNNLQAWNILFRGLGEGPLKCYFNAQVGAYLSQNAAIRAMLVSNGMSELVGTGNIALALNKIVGDIEFIPYDGGYIDTDGTTYVPHIPDDKVILVKRPPMGQSLGAWKSTPSIRNGGPFNPQPGRFNWTNDETMNDRLPKYEYGVGIYGLPILRFPGNVAAVTVVF